MNRGGKDLLAQRASPPTPLRVLIVEDNEADAEVCVLELEKAGYEVSADVVWTPEQFGAALSAQRYDVVLADYRLPGWTAMDALDHVQRHGKDIPVILVTGSLGEEQAAECVKRGVADYVLKDRLARLPTGVRRALEEATLKEERKRAEQALQESEERFRRLSEATFEGVAITEGERILDVNDSFEKLFGYEHSELVGRLVTDLVAPKDRDLVRQMILTRHENPYAATVLRKDGTSFVAELRSRALPYFGRTVGVAAVRDITERKRLEQELQRSQRLEAVGQLAGGVAHDFNNMLMAIMGSSELLARDLESGHPGLREVEDIKRAARRAADLTRQLLAFSRKQVLEPKVLNLNSVVADTEKMLRRLIGEHIELVTKLEPELGKVEADPGQIGQVIINLAVNARDAMPQGGKLTIETANVELDEGYAREHSPTQPGSYAMLAVSDTGIGMDEEVLAHAFEPFFTTKEEGKGTGLGLATVYGIVKQSGGYIWISSEPGLGTTFEIYLPRADTPPESVEGNPATTEALRGSETVVVAEDEKAVLTLVGEFLRRYGYTVLEANRCSKALELCERHEGPVHLLVTDVVMPRMSGRELADRLARLRPEVRVLYISGYADDAIARHGVLEPGTAFLQKPFTPDALARKVREVLDAVPQPLR